LYNDNQIPHWLKHRRCASREPNDGLVVLASDFTTTHRERIINLAAKYRLSAIYTARVFVDDGGLISYSEGFDEYGLAAGYVDRILRGEKPGDLPVQAPTKYDLVINLKTAKVLYGPRPTTSGQGCVNPCCVRPSSRSDWQSL
jgi:ABC-type uncharacterized transport system substrate-binding protein